MLVLVPWPDGTDKPDDVVIVFEVAALFPEAEIVSESRRMLFELEKT